MNNIWGLINAISRTDTWQSLTYCDVLLACGDADRGYCYKGKRYAQLIDSLGDLLKQNNLSVHSVSHRLSFCTGEKAYGTPVSVNRELVRIAMCARMVSLVKGRIAGSYWRETKLKQLWKNILSRCTPKAVISIQPDVGLCNAGHDLRIPIFDLQHGLISDTEDNPYYWSDNLQKQESTDLPHGFLCWDKSSAEKLLPITQKKKFTVRVIGNPWFVRFINPHPQDDLVRLEIDHCSELQGRLPIILVTLQYNLSYYACDYVNNGVMADCLETVIQETSDQYYWNLRLHPSQLSGNEGMYVQKYLKKQFGKLKNVEWETCSHVALPSLLSVANLHITHFSATAIEASWMGVCTGLLDPHICEGGKHEDFYVNERKLGFAEVLPLDVISIKKFINSSLAKNKSEKILLQQHMVCINSFVDEIKNGGISA